MGYDLNRTEELKNTFTEYLNLIMVIPYQIPEVNVPGGRISI